MALDGLYLTKIKDELLSKAVGLRVDKVNQPTRDEIILNLRGKGFGYKLLLCVRADSPRIHFTSHNIDNPPVPPMFCMLLRKHLQGAMIKNVRQHESDRILFIDFDATNEIGDRVELTVCIEIMGKHSNLILISGEKIIDSAKRVDYLTSSVRQILPGLDYKLPPEQDKLSLDTEEVTVCLDRILSYKEKFLSSAIMNSIQGVSPVVSREIASRVTGDDLAVGALTSLQLQRLTNLLEEIKRSIHDSSKVYMLLQKDGKPKDISHFNITQYGDALDVKEYDSCSELLDDFYFERDRINRINHRAHELIKLLNNLLERAVRKLALQREELIKCENKEQLRLYGELILANLFRLKKGTDYYEVENYYDNCNIIKIPCNPALSPTQNQKKYYKEYRKAQTAEKMLADLIAQGEQEIIYLESVLDELSRADTDSEISAIRLELSNGGYIKNTKGKKQKPPKELPPIEFNSSDGFKILVGRNNVQNEKLSLKLAGKNDMWLHTQKIPGSHVVIFGEGRDISDEAIEEAAVIAAYHSKAKDSSLVPVDYTRAKAVKKPSGGKAGMVIYHEYWTIIVNPDKELIEKLKV